MNRSNSNTRVKRESSEGDLYNLPTFGQVKKIKTEKLENDESMKICDEKRKQKEINSKKAKEYYKKNRDTMIKKNTESKTKKIRNKNNVNIEHYIDEKSKINNDPKEFITRLPVKPADIANIDFDENLIEQDDVGNLDLTCNHCNANYFKSL